MRAGRPPARPPKRGAIARRHRQSLCRPLRRGDHRLHGGSEAARPRNGAAPDRCHGRRRQPLSKAMARAPSSAPPASLNTARCGTIRAATRCANFSATPRPSCPRPRRSAAPGRASTFRSPTSTPPMCAAISTRSRSASTMRRAANEIVLVILAMTTGAAHPCARRRPGGRRHQGRGRFAMSVEIRQIITIVEETRIEGGRPVDPPTRRAAAIAVIRNPYAGHVRRGPVGAERYRRGAGRHLAAARGGCAGHRRRSGRELRQGGRGRRRTASSSMPPPSCTPSSAPRSATCWARARR